MTPTDIPAELATSAWQHVTTAAEPMTAASLADAAGITRDAALTLLRDWNVTGHLIGLLALSEQQNRPYDIRYTPVTGMPAGPDQVVVTGSPPEVPADLRELAWRHFAAATGSVTAASLAGAAGITRGAAVMLLRQWETTGHATAEPTTRGGGHGPYHVGYLPSTGTPARPRRVLVTGSRGWTDPTVIRDALAAEWGDGTAVLVTGACPVGADAVAERVWAEWGGQVERHPADWDRHGRRAGHVRNTGMVAAGAEVCLAFIRDHSPGATGTAEAAERAGIPTRRHTQPGGVAGGRLATGRGRVESLGGGRESCLAQDLHPSTAVAVDEGVAVPGKLDVVEPAGADQPVVVHQRDTRLVGHAAHASAARAAGEPSRAAFALGCARRGWPVFPVTPGRKVPLSEWSWTEHNTTDPDRIRRYWGAHPEHNIGIVCALAGLVVLDLDVAKGGERPPTEWDLPGVHGGTDVLAVLCERAGESYALLWETFTVRTASGGFHLYYTAPPDRTLGNTAGRHGGLGWCVDTRGAGGFVVAPGSVVTYDDGTTGTYTVYTHGDVAPLPDWIADRLTKPETPPTVRPATAPLPAGIGDRYAAAALRGEVERVAAAPAGTRNHTLNAAAFALGQLVAAGVLPTDLVEATLTDAAAAAGLPGREAVATIRSGLSAGARHPRTASAA